MTPLRPDLLALVFATVSTLAVAVVGSASPARPLSVSQACNEASTYLDASPSRAELRETKWEVSDGRDTAWLDAQTGELVEIEFAAR